MLLDQRQLAGVGVEVWVYVLSVILGDGAVVLVCG
jgi:hypothetical protein